MRLGVDSVAIVGDGVSGSSYFLSPSFVSSPTFPAMQQDLYNKYMQFATSITTGLPPGKVPVDLSDSQLFVQACDVVGCDRTLSEIATTAEDGYESCTDMVEVSCGVGVSASHTAEVDACRVRSRRAELQLRSIKVSKIPRYSELAKELKLVRQQSFHRYAFPINRCKLADMHISCCCSVSSAAVPL